VQYRFGGSEDGFDLRFSIDRPRSGMGVHRWVRADLTGEVVRHLEAASLFQCRRQPDRANRDPPRVMPKTVGITGNVPEQRAHGQIPPAVSPIPILTNMTESFVLRQTMFAAAAFCSGTISPPRRLRSTPSRSLAPEHGIPRRTRPRAADANAPPELAASRKTTRDSDFAARCEQEGSEVVSCRSVWRCQRESGVLASRCSQNAHDTRAFRAFAIRRKCGARFACDDCGSTRG